MNKYTDDEILRLARERFNRAYESDKDERELARDDLRFAINDEECQWPSDVRDARLNDPNPRPCLVINKIPEKIDQIDGEFRQSRPAIKVRGIDSKADPKLAEIYNGIIRHIEYQCNARATYNTAYASILQAGRGAWRINIQDSTEDVFVRDIVIEPIPNVFTVYWDQSAKKPDKSDAKWVFVTEKITEEEFKSRYPDEDLAEWQAGNDESLNWRDQKYIRIAEYWWKETVEKTVYRVIRYIDNVPTLMTVEKLFEGEEAKEEKTIKSTKVRYCVMTAHKILDGGIKGDWPIQHIPIILAFGKTVNIDGKEKSRGMVRFAKTPQQMYNYWSSSVTEQVALAPKVPYLVTPRMIGNHQAQWNQAHIKNFPYLLFDPDPSSPSMGPRREMPPQMSSAISNELVRMEHDIMSAMGIYQASLGDEGQEKSGKAILARQRQGNTGAFTYTDNMGIALTYSAKVLIDLIPYVYDTERIIRIRGEDDSEKMVPINGSPNMQLPQNVSKDLIVMGQTGYINDITIGKYDVAVTIGPSYATQRQEALELLLDLVKQVPQIGQAAMDLIAKNIDAPGADELYERLKKLVPPELRDPEPGEEQQPQQAQPDPRMMIEMFKMDLQKREQDRKDFEAQVKAIKDLAEAEAKERGQQLQAFVAIANQIKGAMQQLQPTQAPPQPQGMM